MAKKQDASGQPDTERKTRARVLLDCSYGRADEVIQLTADELAAAKASGSVDDHPDAVQYAESLKAPADQS